MIVTVEKTDESWSAVDRSNVRILDVGGLLVEEYATPWISKGKNVTKVIWVRQGFDCTTIEGKPNPVFHMNVYSKKSINFARSRLRILFLEFWKLPSNTLEKDWPVS